MEMVPNSTKIIVIVVVSLMSYNDNMRYTITGPTIVNEFLQQ
jgi:hypothetical protein